VRPDPQDLLTRWLEAEEGDTSDTAEATAADTALLELFAALPLAGPAPAPGFADRVMRRVALETAAESAARPALPHWRERLLRSRGFRLALAGSVAAAGITLPWLPWILAALARLWSFGDVIRLAAGSVIDASRILLVLAGISQWALTLGSALALSATSPAIVKLVTLALIVAGASFVFLRDLITRDRRWSYADRI
jgi:hypothetical protein